MGNIFLKKLELENFKCFKNQTIDFNIPDGNTEGSGLNILIGENGNGKTTILEAINYLTQSTYSSENKLKINDYNDYNEEIVIKGWTSEFKCKLSKPYKDKYFESEGIQFQAKSRESKTPGKLLSSPYTISNLFLNKDDNYKNQTGEDSGNAIPHLHKIYRNSEIENDEINVFYFDSNRTRQLSSGMYKTTYERICDDLNWKFIKKIDQNNVDKILDNICGEYFKNVLAIAQKGSGKKIAQDLKEFFDDDFYKDLKIELLNLLHPFSQSFFAVRKEDSLKQINTKELGSGVEIILTLILLKNLADESKGSIIYLIDEPELHLHPKAQDTLMGLLLQESTNKQIILSTHSPFIYKNCIANNIGINVLRKIKNNIDISNVSQQGWGIFPWSPSWGEINYFAFDLPTIEFHNELYGYLQERENKFKETEIETFFSTNSILQNKQWIRDSGGNPGKSYAVSLCTYIRNSIHHPENQNNASFTPQELRDSIDEMLRII